MLRYAPSIVRKKNAGLGCLAIVILMALAGLPAALPAQSDSERLGMALEYFQSGKYHEALLVFQQLEKKHRLNPRFLAYIGICHYYEWEYDKACLYLDSVMPQMEAYAPHEREVYYHAAAESHFQLRQYAEAARLFQKVLDVCYPNEQPAAYYRLAFCHLFANDWAPALHLFETSLDLYQRYRPEEKARIAQLRIMIGGLYGKVAVGVKDWQRVNRDWQALYGNQLKPEELATVRLRPSIEAFEPVVDSLWLTINEPPHSDRLLGGRPVVVHEDVVHQDTVAQPVEHDINLSDIYQHQTEIVDTLP